MIAKAKKALRLAGNYSSEQLYLARRWWLERTSRQPILVYTIPKTGSSTVWDSLFEARLRDPIYHAHQLTERAVEFYEAAIARGEHARNYARKLDNIQHVRRRLAEDPSKRWKVITLVREPVGRALSSFFQGSWKYFPNFDYTQTPSAAQIDRLIAMFETKREEQIEWWGDWFQRELATVFGIDVFGTPFDHARGYQIYRGPRADLLVVRLENLDACNRVAFAEHLGLADFKLVNTNVGSAKKYRELYATCTARIRLPTDYLDRVYSQPSVSHFYSATEIAKFRERWTRRQ